MPEHMHEYLGAYLDGELDERSRVRVETHIETCPVCQAEMAELSRLSHVLRAAPLPDFIPGRDFQAQVMLRLPRQDENLHASPNSSLLLWLTPGLALAGWLFIQVVLNLSALVSLASQAGLLGDAIRLSAGSPQQLLWFSAAQATLGRLFGAEGQAGLQAIHDAGIFAQSLSVPFFWQLGAAALYWGVLILVWRNQFKTLRIMPRAG